MFTQLKNWRRPGQLGYLDTAGWTFSEATHYENWLACKCVGRSHHYAATERWMSASL
jgi:hypothetical protein